MSVAYRGAKTHFQAIGYRADNTEIGPVSVEWVLEGGEVFASEQLRLGILAGLGSLGAGVDKIGAFDLTNVFGTLDHIASSPAVTFGSFLSGNITITTKRGTASDSVSIRIKQPTFKVKVHQVEGINISSVFPNWKNVAEQVWNREDVVKAEVLDQVQSRASLTYPTPPLSPPPLGAEVNMMSQTAYIPSFFTPLVFDCLLGTNAGGIYYLPRNAGLLLDERENPAINVYVVFRPLNYWADSSFSPPQKEWYYPPIHAISIRDYSIFITQAGVLLNGAMIDDSPRGHKFLAQGIGRIFGLPQYVEWLTNLMDFGSKGGLEVTPLQYITALNYYGNNPQSSFFISEQ